MATEQIIESVTEHPLNLTDMDSSDAVTITNAQSDPSCVEVS
jgi:hypothetical protein